MMRVPFDRKPRPEGTKPNMERGVQGMGGWDALPSRQASKPQLRMEGSLMGMSQVADNPFDMSVLIP